MLLSPSALQHLVQHRVLGHLLGSDHLPLQIVLSLSTRPAPSSSATQQQQATLQQIIPSKDRETVQRYITAMADPSTFDELRQLADSGEASAETLNAAFTRIVISSAIGAGYEMLLSLGQSRPGCTAGTTYGMTVSAKGCSSSSGR